MSAGRGGEKADARTTPVTTGTENLLEGPAPAGRAALLVAGLRTVRAWLLFAQRGFGREFRLFAFGACPRDLVRHFYDSPHRNHVMDADDVELD